MDRVKEFLSTLSHEIRTPLTSIKGFSKTMLESYNDLSDEQKKKFLQIIQEQSQRLINLIENALAAADTDEEYNNLVFKKTDINQILNKSIALVKVNYKNKVYKTNLAPMLFSPLDTDKLEQIFVNVLDNASKYSFENNTIEISTYLAGAYNAISIKNYGSYIPKKNQSEIFNKFYRVESYLNSKVQGTGLGLYIVKMLVSKMNGEIFVNSSEEPKQFTEFIIKFPVFAVEEFMERNKNV